MDSQLKELLEKARTVKLSDEQRETQRVSFAYGNSNFENDKITRSTVIRESNRLKTGK